MRNQIKEDLKNRTVVIWIVVVMIGITILWAIPSLRPLLGFILIIGAILLYFLPSILANKRKKSNATAITVVNLFFGWTLIGWVIALVWALTKDEKHTITVQATENKTSTASELEKLAELKKRGVITEAEFEQQKKKVLG